jgi:ATP synthase protein I
MADPSERRRASDERQRLLDMVERKTKRKARARREGDRPLAFGLGTFGLVGWSIMIPTVLGIALGVWLDARDSGSVSWTLTGLLVGLTLGCLNAWWWVQRTRSGR